MLQNNLKVFLDAKSLSGGTYSTIMRQSGKFKTVCTSCVLEQNKVNFDFTNHICLSKNNFDSWQDAWFDFINTL